MTVRPPSLSALAAFEAVARHQSFTRAARELNLSQSAVSHAVRALEGRLGERLFDRRPGGAALTQAGRLFAARVRLGLSLLGDAFAQARPGAQTLVVSTLSSIAQRLIVPRLGSFRALHPGLVLDLRCTAALADVGAGEADVAVRFGPGQWSGLQSRRLSEEWLIPVASPDYRGGGAGLTLDDLPGCELIAHPESAWAIWLDGSGLDAGRLRTGLLVDDALLALEAAAAGLGIALARSRLAEADLASGRLVRVGDRKVRAEYDYWCAWSGTARKQAEIAAFVDWATEALREGGT